MKKLIVLFSLILSSYSFGYYNPYKGPNRITGEGGPRGGFPGSGFATGGFPGSGFATGGFPGSGFATGGFPGSGFATGGFPGSGFATGGFPGKGGPRGGFGGGFPGMVCSKPLLQEDNKVFKALISAHKNYYKILQAKQAIPSIEKKIHNIRKTLNDLTRELQILACEKQKAEKDKK